MLVTTPLYVGIAAIALVALFVNVVRMRFKHQVSLGDGGHDELIRARSVHGNFIEIVPFVLMIMAALEVQGYHDFVLHGFGVALMISRICHVFGVYHKTTVGKLRMVGSALALSLIAIGGGLLLVSYIL